MVVVVFSMLRSRLFFASLAITILQSGNPIIPGWYADPEAHVFRDQYYAVAYAIGSSPFGPFERIGKILQQDPAVATGAGHHSVLQSPGSKKWYIVYHRRPLGETDRNHRVVCIDELRFDDKGLIQPVTITAAGVPPDPIR